MTRSHSRSFGGVDRRRYISFISGKRVYFRPHTESSIGVKGIVSMWRPVVRLLYQFSVYPCTIQTILFFLIIGCIWCSGSWTWLFWSPWVTWSKTPKIQSLSSLFWFIQSQISVLWKSLVSRNVRPCLGSSTPFETIALRFFGPCSLPDVTHVKFPDLKSLSENFFSPFTSPFTVRIFFV